MELHPPIQHQMTNPSAKSASPTLIFPAGTARSVANLAACKRGDQATVGVFALYFRTRF